MNIKKSETEKLNPVMASMTFEMIGKLDKIALTNSISRNEVIRIACQNLFINKKKLNLK